jgi:LysR family glycine cleavage system transcriptional activator
MIKIHDIDELYSSIIQNMRRLPPLTALRVFEAAARHESFSHAADELFITASAVSHQVKSLEKFLGTPLFSRQKRKVSLTATGEKYFIVINQVMNQIEVETQRLIAHPGTDTVTLSVTPYFLVRWMMPRMQHFQERHPDVELQISASTGLIDFDNSHTDMAIYFGHGDWPDVEAIYLRHVTLTPVCSPRLLHGRYPLSQPEDLRHHKLIHVARRLHEWPDWLRLAGVKPHDLGHGLRFSSSQLATAAAQESLGVALADASLSSREIESGQLLTPFDTALDTHKSLYLVYRKGRPLGYGMQAFSQWIIQEMANYSPASTPA